MVDVRCSTSVRKHLVRAALLCEQQPTHRCPTQSPHRSSVIIIPAAWTPLILVHLSPRPSPLSLSQVLVLLLADLLLTRAALLRTMRLRLLLLLIALRLPLSQRC